MLLRLLLVFFSTFFLAFPNHRGTCTQSGPIPHAIRTNPLPCQKKVVILHSHSALGSQWLIAFVVADFAKGFRHAEIKRSIAPPLPIRAKLFGDPD